MRGEKHPAVLEGTHGAVGLRRLLRPRPDVQTRAIQMCAPAPSRCAHPLRADARQRPSRCAPPAHPPRARASPAQMCTRARALQLCLLPQMCRCLAGGEAAGAPRAHPGLIPGSSRASCQPQPFKGRDCGFLSAPGRNAPVRGPRCYSWLCQGLIGRGRASSLLPCPLPWAAGSPRDAAGSSLAPGMGESKDKAPF